jgi:GNAT superfamily N-acetyltransferase
MLSYKWFVTSKIPVVYRQKLHKLYLDNQGIPINTVHTNCIHCHDYTGPHTWEVMLKHDPYDEYLWFLVFLDNILVGFARRSIRNGRIITFVIDKNYRNRGIGTWTVVKLAQAGNTIYQIMPKWGQSKAFFENLGFSHSYEYKYGMTYDIITKPRLVKLL